MSVIGQTWDAAANSETLRFPAEGALLAGRLIRPAGPPHAAVVILGATGAPMGFYRAFAEWLAATRGLAVLIYDYRDFGASSNGPLAASKATMSDWGLRDQSAALDALRRMVPDVPLWVIGHSLGGLMLGFHPAMAGVERTILVASGLPHVSDHPVAFRAVARLFWHVLPPVVRLAGYLPGRRFGFGADLPAGVYREWRRWCLTPGFHLSDIGTRLPMPDPALVKGRMRVVAVADDAWVTPAAAWRVMALYPNAIKSQRLLHPARFGLPKIGHLGAFSRANAVVWPALLD